VRYQESDDPDIKKQQEGKLSFSTGAIPHNACWIIPRKPSHFGQNDLSQNIFLNFFLFFIHLFICAYIVCSIFPPYPLVSRQNLFCPFLQFCWREDISNNKEDKAFLLVEIRIATQRQSQHCFHAQVYYNPKWFISTRTLHYFLVTFP
jgi:hypothetical protein